MKGGFLKQAKIRVIRSIRGVLRVVVRGLIVLGWPLYKVLFGVKKGINKSFNYRKAAIYLLLSSILVSLSIGGIFFYREILVDLPQVTKIDIPPAMSTKLLDRNERLLYKFYTGENRTWIPLSKIPQSLVWATIAIEDKDFYQHPGVSLKGVVQALIYDFKTHGDNGLRGGSTITQQLVKNVFLSQEKTWQRKMKEVLLAFLVEWKLDKNQILERYFNQVSYGGETYGVQEASLRYFGKNVWELTMAESAFLAGIPAAPTTYSPNGPNKDLAFARQRHVLDEMASSGFITPEKAEGLKKVPLNLREDATVMRYPHFVFYVKDYLVNRFQLTNLDRAGLTVVTSIDPIIQEEAQRIVKEEVDKIRYLRISNGAALVLDVRTGGILAMVGSKDYYATDIDGKYNVTTALRQPGSSIKPVNYLLALERGRTLISTIDDSPITYEIKGQKPYTPQNYNGKFMGTVTLRTALASSLNVPSVKLLAENGVENMARLGQSMGITSWNDSSRWGLSLALGSNEVKMVDLSQAYSIFANMGSKIEINPIEQIKDFNGKVLWQKNNEGQQLIAPVYAYLINSVLSDDNARAPIFGLNSKLNIDGKTVSVKTGTTNNLKDNWTIGWTPDYLVATWVGNNDSTPMSWVASGVTGASPIWNKIMTELLKNKADKPWVMPAGIVEKNICGRDEYFVMGTENNVACPVTPTGTPTPRP
ncbi:PBP1A family penicillin-binding protein [Patescibacteria group bacterium]|nr:PBP1A family penicillin-binding protein [Patescibacteria group bacterium]